MNVIHHLVKVLDLCACLRNGDDSRLSKLLHKVLFKDNYLKAVPH